MRTKWMALAVGLLLLAVGASLAWRRWAMDPVPRAESPAQSMEGARTLDSGREDLSTGNAVGSGRVSLPSLDTLITVVAGGTPVPGAVLLMACGDQEQQAISDARGQVHWHGSAECRLAITVHLDGRAPELHRFDPPWPVPLVVDLGGTRIAGSVLRGTTDVTPEGAVVVAFPDTMVPSCSVIQQSILGVDSATSVVVATRTDALGQFELAGLQSGVLYKLRAGKLGTLTEPTELAVLAGSNSPPLVLREILGVEIRFSSGSAEGISTNRDLRNSPGMSVHSLDYVLHGGELQEWEAVLAQVPDVDCTGFDRAGLELLYLSTDGRKEAGPIVVEARVPGYAPTVQRTQARSVRDGIPVFHVDLTPNVSRWGRIDVTLHGLADVSEVGEADVASMGLLRMVDGRGTRSALSLLPAARHSYEGIPEGEYRVWLEVPGNLRIPSQGEELLVRIGEDPAVVELDLSGVGALLVDLFGEGSDTRATKLTLRVSRIGHFGFQTYSISKLPCLFPLVQPGNYDIALLLGIPMALPGEEPYRGTCEIRPGEVTHVSLIGR